MQYPEKEWLPIGKGIRQGCILYQGVFYTNVGSVFMQNVSDRKMGQIHIKVGWEGLVPNLPADQICQPVAMEVSNIAAAIWGLGLAF